MDVQEQLFKYVKQLTTEGKNEEEIIRTVAKWKSATQVMISQAMDINLRRVKYLFKKYGIRRYNQYHTTKRCTHCGEDVHVSCFEVEVHQGKVRQKRVCYSCQREYYRQHYMKRVIARKWTNEQIKKEIFIMEYQLATLKELLD
ncbi:hypothetical protein [Brevibacillus laterosporus]|uniref:hypothetical protein n=1 Tax=Brevibacillus laterosporus TaxID=1465 RepID=UPI0026529381|nr:hypothetical protein [Brevibacillus laterosporus]MDN9012832.1 hypothetical protein [Brevibacillus laterosporus]MDO0943918.1 hypothetical protein [Brevibacillus laterosporus]